MHNLESLRSLDSTHLCQLARRGRANGGHVCGGYLRCLTRPTILLGLNILLDIFFWWGWRGDETTHEVIHWQCLCYGLIVTICSPLWLLIESTLLPIRISPLSLTNGSQHALFALRWACHPGLSIILKPSRRVKYKACVSQVQGDEFQRESCVYNSMLKFDRLP